jgi:hypothetical protein
MTTLDARRATRFDVQLTCRVSSPLQNFSRLSGVTLNMSRCGLLATFEEAAPLEPMPAIGQPARIILELPQSRSVPRRCLECLARVVRVAQEPASRQVAFDLRRFQFRDELPDPSLISESFPEFTGDEQIQ